MLQRHLLLSLSARRIRDLHLRVPLVSDNHKLLQFDQYHSTSVLLAAKAFKAEAEEPLPLMEMDHEAVPPLRARLRASDAKQVLEDCPLGLHPMGQSVWSILHHFRNPPTLVINPVMHNLLQRLHMHLVRLLSIWPLFLIRTSTKA